MKTCSNCAHWRPGDDGCFGTCDRSLTGRRRRRWYDQCGRFAQRPTIPVFTVADLRAFDAAGPPVDLFDHHRPQQAGGGA